MGNETGSRHFGAFRGVFVPTFLSIIGVILFLRLGYIVGSAGVMGALAIIFLAVSITFATGLSLSSITTNIRIGAGGAYSIISRTLGMEVGGSVGVPLYLAQAFSVLLYIFGFAETWNFLFPHHSKILVLFIIFFSLFSLTMIDLKYAIRAQLVVFFFVIAALGSVFAGGGWWHGALQTPLVTDFSGAPFWALFALFFPAVTGLMAGVGMSGELSDPKKQIPKGVLWGLGITTVIYVAVIFWFGYSATPDQLINDNLMIVELSRFGSLVLIGILAATFSSALTTFVAAPRLLQALGDNSILPVSHFFAAKTKKGDPRNATAFTALLIFIVLPFSNLDSIAPFLTMFFLITYGTINLVVYIEQSLGFVSFRPTLRIPRFVPLYGAIGSLVFMFYIDVIAGLVALGFLVFMYLLLVQRKLHPKHGDVRSGLFLALSEWAARKVMSLPESTKHIWRPTVLLPVLTSRKLLGNYPLIRSIVHPNGTLSVLGMELKAGGSPGEKSVEKKDIEHELEVMKSLADKFGKEGIFTTYTHIHADEYFEGVCVSMEAIEGQFFHPNILFLPASPAKMTKTGTQRMFETAEETESGIMIFDKDSDIGLGSEQDIHVWLPPEVLEQDFYDEWPFDLSLLIAYRLHRNWSGNITLWMCVNEEDQAKANQFLRRTAYEARFPAGTQILVSTDTLNKSIRNAPKGDIHIIPVKDLEDMYAKSETVSKIKRSFLFVKDSGKEDILA